MGRGVLEVPRYRYRRINDPEVVEIVASSFGHAPSGMVVFCDVIEENGVPLRRQVDARRVRVSGEVELVEITAGSGATGR